ncbi:serine O-acetyltransferase [Cellulosilyticum ruminicola]|uniref:serine O-acetyltransferase n=1 Tax=Cellulosilyticum ruminicola TaxID=425254 RepID=UPI0006D27FAC|nr:serine O-acetyltransferase [Cellulosilyticum ruminicola]
MEDNNNLQYITRSIKEQIRECINIYIPRNEWDALKMSSQLLDELIQEIAVYIEEDLMALKEKDPAAGKLEYVFKAYLSFKAVRYYRIAHAIYCEQRLEVSRREQIARLMSERVKVETKIEIHPASQIGKRFIIDHGVGVVIGETAIIGDDCYILQGVIIGARGIAYNQPGKRHPTIGNNVQIGGGSRLLGPINIGDNVIINPNCVVTSNIPRDTTVSISNQMQISYNKQKERILIYGVIPKPNNQIEIYGKNLSDLTLHFIDEETNIIDDIDIEVLSRDEEKICAQVYYYKEKVNYPYKKINLKAVFDKQTEIVIMDAVGLGKNLLRSS